jgi:hypothetical protein
MVARYDMADGQFITLRHRDGKVHITAANMMVETGDEVKAIIADFLSRATTPGNCSKISKNRSEINENRSKISETPKSLRKRRNHCENARQSSPMSRRPTSSAATKPVKVRRR